VYYTMSGMEDAMAIPAGAFADPSFTTPGFSVYEERMHGWVHMPDDIEYMAWATQRPALDPCGDISAAPARTRRGNPDPPLAHIIRDEAAVPVDAPRRAA
jgi:hypothetical protein